MSRPTDAHTFQLITHQAGPQIGFSSAAFLYAQCTHCVGKSALTQRPKLYESSIVQKLASSKFLVGKIKVLILKPPKTLHPVRNIVYYAEWRR